MPRKAGRRKRISAEVVVLKTVRFKFWITVNSGISGSGCHSCRRELLTKTGCISLNAAFCRLVFLQLPSSQIDMAEACGSRIYPLSESKGVTRRRNPSKTTRRNTSERLLPTDCPRVSFTRFSSPAAPFEPPCYLLSAMLLEPPVCRCSRLSEYQRDGVAPAAPSHQPSRRVAWSNSCV
jgi:hypothetical protein